MKSSDVVKWVILVILVSFAAVLAIQEIRIAMVNPFSEEIVIRAGQEKLRSELRDPDSLQIISEVAIVGDPASSYSCEYRAKNGFGGYSGSDFFTIDLAPSDVENTAREVKWEMRWIGGG